MSVVRIQRREKGNWKSVPLNRVKYKQLGVPLNKVRHKQLGLVVGGPFRILVDGVTVYENKERLRDEIGTT